MRVLAILPTVKTVGYKGNSQKNLSLPPTFRSGEAMNENKTGFSPAKPGGIANSAQRRYNPITLVTNDLPKKL